MRCERATRDASVACEHTDVRRDGDHRPRDDDAPPFHINDTSSTSSLSFFRRSPARRTRAEKEKAAGAFYRARNPLRFNFGVRERLCLPHRVRARRRPRRPVPPAARSTAAPSTAAPPFLHALPGARARGRRGPPLDLESRARERPEEGRVETPSAHRAASSHGVRPPRADHHGNAQNGRDGL